MIGSTMLSPIPPIRADWLRAKLVEEASKRRVVVAIGIGLEREDYPEKVCRDVQRAVESGVAEVRVVGDKEAIERARRVYSDINAVTSRYPETELVNMLVNGEVDAVVRGTLSARKVIAELKRAYTLERLHRIGMLETYSHEAFFFAPVGIDEGNDLHDKVKLVEGGLRLHRALGLTPIVAVLSGGRIEDYGRSSEVDEMMDQAEELVKQVRERFGVEAYHQGILIEDAVKRATLIIAPNGIVGNIVFRVLTLIGGGGAFGAPVVDLLPRVFVDVSRAMSNYFDSIALSAALANLASTL
ncbi:MAG: hypothetical protein DRJ68_00410 [Thermoprotei archaeon]|nr:MAG: hypothetical protein DRJ68_00410 [Thermoprotei archaeon]